MKKISLFVGFILLSLSTNIRAAEPTKAEFNGYKVVHHMGELIKHVDEYGLNSFNHARIADHTFFVITPNLDTFYSKAVADLRVEPVVVTIPKHDGRYMSIQVFDHEHHTVFDEKVDGGEVYVIAREDYKGKLPDGKVVRTNSSFPFIFIRTQSFSLNEDSKADAIRRQLLITGKAGKIHTPDPKDTQAVISWSNKNSIPYEKTKSLLKKAESIYTLEVHKATFAYLSKFAASGQLISNEGMFESIDDPAGGDAKIRAAGVMLGHLGLPVHHAYYENISRKRDGSALKGSTGPVTITLPYKPGVKDFWSVTRYDAKTYLPMDLPINVFNAFNMKPDTNGNVTITFSIEDPKDGTYWMPVLEDGYYFVTRYYGPTSALNGHTSIDLFYKDGKIKRTVEFK